MDYSSVARVRRGWGLRTQRAATILACCLVMACDDSPTGPTVALNSQFELAPGATAIVEEIGARVTFNGVSGDSRCPADAFCIQGGDAIVRITLTSNRGSRGYELHTGDMRPVSHDGITVTLVQLQPYPFSSRTIRPEDYRATISVSRS